MIPDSEDVGTSTIGAAEKNYDIEFHGRGSVLKESWAKSHWRPGMAWLYMVICACDFVLFPVLWAVLHATTGHDISQWKPITLEGAGLIHLAFGAILGVAAYGRSKEKINGSS